jgi:hypothetical protein
MRRPGTRRKSLVRSGDPAARDELLAGTVQGVEIGATPLVDPAKWFRLGAQILESDTGLGTSQGRGLGGCFLRTRSQLPRVSGQSQSISSTASSSVAQWGSTSRIGLGPIRASSRSVMPSRSAPEPDAILLARRRSSSNMGLKRIAAVALRGEDRRASTGRRASMPGSDLPQQRDGGTLRTTTTTPAERTLPAGVLTVTCSTRDARLSSRPSDRPPCPATG